MANRLIVVSQSTVDFMQSSACIGAIVIGAVLFLASAATVIGIVVVGAIMIIDAKYQTMLNQWEIVSIAYIAIMTTYVVYRTVTAHTTAVYEENPYSWRAFSYNYTNWYERDRWRSNDSAAQSDQVDAVILPATCDQENMDEYWTNHLLASPGTLPVVVRGMGGGSARALIWTRTVAGLCISEIDGCSVTIRQAGPSLWFWTVSMNGAILREGQALTFSQAEDCVLSMMSNSGGPAAIPARTNEMFRFDI